MVYYSLCLLDIRGWNISLVSRLYTQQTVIPGVCCSHWFGLDSQSFKMWNCLLGIGLAQRVGNDQLTRICVVAATYGYCGDSYHCYCQCDDSNEYPLLPCCIIKRKTYHYKHFYPVPHPTLGTRHCKSNKILWKRNSKQNKINPSEFHITELRRIYIFLFYNWIVYLNPLTLPLWTHGSDGRC